MLIYLVVTALLVIVAYRMGVNRERRAAQNAMQVMCGAMYIDKLDIVRKALEGKSLELALNGAPAPEYSFEVSYLGTTVSAHSAIEVGERTLHVKQLIEDIVELEATNLVDL